MKLPPDSALWDLVTQKIQLLHPPVGIAGLLAPPGGGGAAAGDLFSPARTPSLQHRCSVPSPACSPAPSGLALDISGCRQLPAGPRNNSGCLKGSNHCSSPSHTSLGSGRAAMLRQASSIKGAQKYPNKALQQLTTLINSPRMSLPALPTDAQRGAEPQPVSQEMDGPERGRSSEGAQHRRWAGEDEGWVSASSCCCSSCPDGAGVPPLLGVAPARCQLCSWVQVVQRTLIAVQNCVTNTAERGIG